MAMPPEMTWEEQCIHRFFSARKCPTREECDQAALSFTDSSDIVQVAVPGSLSYTVIAVKKSTRPSDQINCQTIVSFRGVDSQLNEWMVRLAQEVHGELVPVAESHGVLPGSRPPLYVYTMPFLPGVACLNALSDEPELDKEQEEQHVHFVNHLARYFARCWNHSQNTTQTSRDQQKSDILDRLLCLQAFAASPVSASALSELSLHVPRLFSDEHPQVLVHGDLSKTNVLVDENTYAITGIVDWSLARVQLFGLELDSLYLMTGCMDFNGWHDYAYRPRLLDAFWAEFWAVAGIEDDAEKRQDIRKTAEFGAVIGAILRYGFQRNTDGSASKNPSTSEAMHKMLKAWLKENIS